MTMQVNCIKSQAHSTTRYRLANCDYSYRIPMALGYATFFRTLGDGDTQHDSDMTVSTVPMAIDLINSCYEALKEAMRSGNQEMIDAIVSAMHVSTMVSIDEVMKAQKLCIAGKQVYVQHRSIVTGAKYRNMRDAEPVGEYINESSSVEELSRFRHSLIAGKYPNILEWIISAYESDKDCCIQLRKLCEDNAIPYCDMMQAVRNHKMIMELCDSWRQIKQFTRTVGE